MYVYIYIYMYTQITLQPQQHRILYKTQILLDESWR